MRKGSDQTGLPFRSANRGIIGCLVALLPLMSASCVPPGDATAGRIQPQSINGPCDVKKFFIVPFTRTFTDMTLSNPTQTCRFTMFNADLQLIQNAALLTQPPQRGQAVVELINGNRQVAISYTPGPGFAGSDQFTATVQPGNKTVTVNVKTVAQ
jgi:hypothetical protein